MKVRESVSIKSVRGLSVMWGGDGEWPFFVKAPDFSRKDAMACMPSLVPRRSGRYSVCDAWRRIVRYSSKVGHDWMICLLRTPSEPGVRVRKELYKPERS